MFQDKHEFVEWNIWYLGPGLNLHVVPWPWGTKNSSYNIEMWEINSALRQIPNKTKCSFMVLGIVLRGLGNCRKSGNVHTGWLVQYLNSLTALACLQSSPNLAAECLTQVPTLDSCCASTREASVHLSPTTLATFLLRSGGTDCTISEW